MNRPAGGTLYSPRLLALAVELAEYPFDPDASLHGEARSRSCGSEIALSAGNGFRTIGMRVTACAVGQAAAAIFVRHAEGATFDQIEEALRQITDWLGEGGTLPDWPDFSLLEAARDYPGRHGALQLPWRAALDALSKAGAGR